MTFLALVVVPQQWRFRLLVLMALSVVYCQQRFYPHTQVVLPTLLILILQMKCATLFKLGKN